MLRTANIGSEPKETTSENKIAKIISNKRLTILNDKTQTKRIYRHTICLQAAINSSQ